MCLIRGLGGLGPCPVCLVPKGTLSDLKTRYPDRTASATQELVTKIEPAAQKEDVLKKHGLRRVNVSLCYLL